MHSLMHYLVARYGLSADAARQLWQLGLPGQPDAQWQRRLPLALAWVAALLLGAGLIFWVAAHWQAQTRATKLLVLQAAVLAPALAAALLARWRGAALLLATLALGGLLAFVGQTYQTGADAWQLFATWAALALAWTLVARSDVLWALWLLVAAAGLALWSGSGLLAVALPLHPVQSWSQPLLWLPLWLLPLGLSRWPLCAPPATDISRRLAALLALMAWTGYGLWGLFWWKDWGLYLLTVALVLLPLGQAWRSRPRDLPVLALGLLALNVLVLSAVARGLWQSRVDEVGAFFVISALTLLSIGGSASWLYRLQQQQQEELA